MPLFTFIMESVFVLNRYNVGTCACNPPKTIVAPSIERLYPIFNGKYFAMRKVQMHAGAKMQVIVWFCVGTGDNPLAKASGLSSRSHAKTIL